MLMVKLDLSILYITTIKMMVGLLLILKQVEKPMIKIVSIKGS